MNYLSMRDYRNAISLALTMEQPGRLLSLFKQIMSTDSADSDSSEANSVTGKTSVDMVLQKLPPAELVSLLRHVRDWNANAKTSQVAQTVLHVLFKLRTIDDILNALESSAALVVTKTPASTAPNTFSLNELVQALIPYTERHLARLDRLVQDSYVLDYVLGEMDGGLVVEDDGMEVDL